MSGKITEKKIEYEFGYAIVERLGQEPASEGDRVMVYAAIYLPACDIYCNLTHELHFGERVTCMDENLGQKWGKASKDQQFRLRFKYFTASTWAMAYTVAEDYIAREMSKISQALAARKLALENAEL